MPRTLHNMVVLITGASAGIGRALAEALSARGAKLVLASRRKDRLDALNMALGGRHLVVPADVSVESDCRRLVEAAAAHFGRIDTLVCNAGYGLIRPVAGTSAAEMQQIFQTNVFGTADCIRFAVPLMLRQDLRDGHRAHILIVSSAAARRGLPYFGAYSATKAAQLSLAEALRVELHPHAIAVSSVHPITTDTDYFTTAEQLSGRRLPPRPGIEMHQSPAAVARAILRGIQRPRPEIWPHRLTRSLLNIGIAFPRLTDAAMLRRAADFHSSPQSDAE